MSNVCPACEAGVLVARIGNKTIRFENAPLVVKNLHYSACPNCGEKVVLPRQAKQNDVIYADAKKERLGLWSCGAIESFRKRWSLTQAAASGLFGGGVNAFSKYERGEVLQSRSMDLLMRVFDELEEARILLSERAGIEISVVPSWETIRVGSAPRNWGINSEFVRTFGVMKQAAANNERWETSDAANG
jgi:HTH-type transcriptional regulator/antitoxin MqsA